jgi:glutamate--cysteine ligase
MALASPVPHLITAQRGPLLQLESLLLRRQSEIEGWLRRQWIETPAPFYASVDLRNAGYKLAPVDTNLFPAGFNNLNPAFDPLCVQALQSAMERVCPTAAGVLLIPENHTRNRFYLESLASLTGLLGKAGFRVRLGSLSPEVTAPQKIALDSGRELLLEPLQRDGDRLRIGDFSPCAILLNNDLSGGRPEILEGLAQPVIPPLGLGWANRLKSQHFALYREVVQEFAARIDLDPWLVDPLFRNCGQINFMKREGEDCLAGNVALLLEEIREKYREYGIEREPYVVVKADAGTYGMAVMTARSPEDVRDMNRKQRTRMAALKEGREVTGAIIQEGVYTSETWGPAQSTAEPVVYMIDHYVVGGFYRIHSGKAANENLNSPGMEFQPLAFAGSCSHPDHSQDPDAEPNRFYAYGVVARLALLAAAREIAGSRNVPA